MGHPWIALYWTQGLVDPTSSLALGRDIPQGNQKIAIRPGAGPAVRLCPPDLKIRTGRPGSDQVQVGPTSGIRIHSQKSEPPSTVPAHHPRFRSQLRILFRFCAGMGQQPTYTSQTDSRPGLLQDTCRWDRFYCVDEAVSDADAQLPATFSALFHFR